MQAFAPGYILKDYHQTKKKSLQSFSPKETIMATIYTFIAVVITVVYFIIYNKKTDNFVTAVTTSALLIIILMLFAKLFLKL